MTNEELKKRLVVIRGIPLEKKVSSKEVTRRDLNHVEVQESEDMFDSFFEFEEDLSQIESARVQMEKLEKQKLIEEKLSTDIPIIEDKEIVPEEESFLMLELPEEEDEPLGSEDSFLVFPEETEEKAQEEEVSEDKAGPETEVKEEGSMPSFKQCAFVKTDDERCKRQAPKKSDYCSAHRKMLLEQS